LQLEQLLLSQAPQQNAFWPLSFASPKSVAVTASGSGHGPAQGPAAAASGLPLSGLSDTPLPQALVGPGRPASRLSYDAGAGSSTRKRDKLLMNLVAVQDAPLAGEGQQQS
jgi:hypothetical protein